MPFLTQGFLMIFKMRVKWRYRPLISHHHIPAQPPTIWLSLSLNPAVTFYTTNVYGNGLNRQIVVPFAAKLLI
jgi:hypothetical protein